MSLNYQLKNYCGNRGVKYTITSQEKIRLLGIYIGNRLNFDYHISQLCKKADKKLHALTRVSKYMNISQRKLMSQFSYCPLIWMFHSQFLEHKINRIHERTLRLIYPNQRQLTFKELLEKNKTVSKQQRNLQTLETEIYKAKNKTSPEVANSLFEFRNVLEMRQCLKGRDISQSIMEVKVLFPKICEIVPDSIKNVKTISIFKNRIKTWIIDKGPRRLCKNYIGQVGFI